MQSDDVHVPADNRACHAVIALGLLRPASPDRCAWRSTDRDLFTAAALRMTEVMTYGARVSSALVTRWETAIIAAHDAANRREPGIWPPRAIASNLFAPIHWGLRWLLDLEHGPMLERLVADPNTIAAVVAAEQEIGAVLCLMRELGPVENWRKSVFSASEADQYRFRGLIHAAVEFPQRFLVAMQDMAEIDWLTVVAGQLPQGIDLPLRRAANDP